MSASFCVLKKVHQPFSSILYPILAVSSPMPATTYSQQPHDETQPDNETVVDFVQFLTDFFDFFYP